jgi:hypothetical protein
MRADYATSDLISKVNSDWINAVLANPELDRAYPGHAAVISELRRQSARKQATPLRCEPVPPAANSTRAGEPGITVEPAARPSRRRSLARRVVERLALAVAALGLAWAGVRMAPGPADVTSSVSVHAASALPESAAPIDTTESSSAGPAWLLPEILYGPAMAPSPMPPAQEPRAVPKPAR